MVQSYSSGDNDVPPPPCNTCFLQPTRVHNSNGISIGSAVFAQLTAECHWACLSLSCPIKIALSHGGIWTPSNTWFLEPTRAHNPDVLSICSVVFAQLMAESCRTCPDMSFPIKIAPSHGGSGPLSNACFLRPT